MGVTQSTQLPRLKTPTVLHKLKRSLGKRLRSWRISKRQKADDTTTTPMLRSARGRKPLALRRNCMRLGMWRPMPRCSSFGSGLALTMQTTLPLDESLFSPTPLPPPQLYTLAQRPPTPAAIKRRIKNQEPKYDEWKSLFEKSSGQLTPTTWQCPSVHDISEALAGQLTPHGFPSHTDKRRCAQALPPPPSPPVFRTPPASVSSCAGSERKVRRRLSLRLPKVRVNTSVRKNLSLSVQRHQLATPTEKHYQQELLDIKDYFGGVYYT